MTSIRKEIHSLMILCISLVVFVSACNYPGISATSTGPSVKEMRQTLDAISVLGNGTALPPESNPLATLYPEATPGTQTTPGTPLASAPLPGGEPLVGLERIQYFTQPGDTLPSLALRFEVTPAMILAPTALPSAGLLPEAVEIWIPNQVGSPPYPQALLPDMEVINSLSAADFDVGEEINRRGGRLSYFVDTLQNEKLTAAEIIQRVSIESSINPRLLLALIELQTGWLTGQRSERGDDKYPLGFHVSGSEGLYRELLIAATHLNIGYYGWRNGSTTKIWFLDGVQERLDPRLNAGTVALQNMFTRLYRKDRWYQALYGPGGFLEVYRNLFGDPWVLSAQAGNVLPPNAQQPALELPFSPGERWSLTGGPHPSWKTGSPRGALDFAPVTGELACSVSYTWVLSPAPGLVARSARNAVAVDLDGDGKEQTGWVIIFMHIADRERIAVGTQTAQDMRIGHPSCEGGTSTGTHVHIARKFNGEWIAADGPLPFVLSGWQVFSSEKNYQGGMVKEGQQVVASPVGPRTSIVIR